MEIKYRLESIAETEFKMDYDFDYSGLNPENLKVQVGHDIKPIMDKDQVVVKAKASLVYGDEETELATNTVSMRFGLSPIKEVIILKDDGSFSTQNTLVLDTFLVAAIGALRGVMMKNLKGTPLEAFYLPLIPMEHFRAKSK
ncbi:MAG: hypothetical protein VZR28_03720 [Candidatus Cryptobacteroides sp.]|jgi:hypothetical protein|nr:hypothetical protein [Candidatus Cryptobacteroides sp.]